MWKNGETSYRSSKTEWYWLFWSVRDGGHCAILVNLYTISRGYSTLTTLIPEHLESRKLLSTVYLHVKMPLDSAACSQGVCPLRYQAFEDKNEPFFNCNQEEVVEFRKITAQQFSVDELS